MASEVAEKVSLALDWTPNTNHVGFFVAKELGYYADAGICLQIVSPHVDGYQTTPAAKVASKSATFALAPSETVISYHLPPERPKLVAVAAVIQEDLSAIVTLKSSGIARPRELDNKVYASYGARFEGRIVQRLIQADGGSGDFLELTPDKLGIWNTVLTGQADATWIFKGWEGVEADLKNVELNEFSLGHYGIPYCYTPVVLAHPDTLSEKPDIVRKFLKASELGFSYAVQNPLDAAELLSGASQKETPFLPDALDPNLVLKSLHILTPHFLNKTGNWGVMEKQKWDQYIEWLSNEGLLTSHIQSRNPEPGLSVSLDDLRRGNAGELLSSTALSPKDVFSNAFLTV